MKKLTQAILMFFIFGKMYSFQQSGNGLSARSISGFHISKDEDSLKAGFLAGWALEYTYNSENVSFSLDFSYPYYDALFNSKDQIRITFSEFIKVPYYALFTFPIISPSIVFNINENDRISIGAAYLWGFIASYRKLIADRISFNVHLTWFIDRYFRSGLHDFHIYTSFEYLIF